LNQKGLKLAKRISRGLKQTSRAVEIAISMVGSCPSQMPVLAINNAQQMETRMVDKEMKE